MTPGPAMRGDLARELQRDAMQKGCIARMARNGRGPDRVSSPRVAALLRRTADRLDPPTPSQDGIRI